VLKHQILPPARWIQIQPLQVSVTIFHTHQPAIDQSVQKVFASLYVSHSLSLDPFAKSCPTGSDSGGTFRDHRRSLIRMYPSTCTAISRKVIATFMHTSPFSRVIRNLGGLPRSMATPAVRHGWSCNWLVLKFYWNLSMSPHRNISVILVEACKGDKGHQTGWEDRK
jgi:hypothetical protein